MENKEDAVKYCKCGCVVSGNYHVNVDSEYVDKTVNKKSARKNSEIGTVWVKKCKDHGCTNPVPR
jgi:hypothetical protein